jgi:hypothetical protein
MDPPAVARLGGDRRLATPYAAMLGLVPCHIPSVVFLTAPVDE